MGKHHQGCCGRWHLQSCRQWLSKRQKSMIVIGSHPTEGEKHRIALHFLKSSTSQWFCCRNRIEMYRRKEQGPHVVEFPLSCCVLVDRSWTSSQSPINFNKLQEMRYGSTTPQKKSGPDQMTFMRLDDDDVFPFRACHGSGKMVPHHAWR